MRFQIQRDLLGAGRMAHELDEPGHSEKGEQSRQPDTRDARGQRKQPPIIHQRHRQDDGEDGRTEVDHPGEPPGAVARKAFKRLYFSSKS